MKYVPTTTQATDVNGLRNWAVNELHRLSSSLGNEDAATAGDLDAEIAARAAADAALAAQIEDLYVSTDGSNRTYAQTSAPSSPNIGDLWFDTDNNNIVTRWSGTAWQPVDDARIAANAAAIAAEISARQSADGTLTSSVLSLGTRTTTLENTVGSPTDGNLALKARIATEETARASGDTALASRATALEATVNNATTGVAATAARLTTEETARASADSALASRATALEATVNSPTDGNTALKARIATEETARASGDTAIASSVSSLTATVSNNFSTLNAAIEEEETARASADSALASRASSLEATVNSATDGNLALKARIATEESARAGGDSALATRASALEATVNSPTTGNTALQARIATEETARASADNALASRASALEATVNSATTGNVALQARLASEETARASADSALASSISSLTATVNNNNSAALAAIDEEETARASADSALASSISSLTATVNSNNTTLQSRIAAEESARATGDDALAIRATALEATVNSGTTGNVALQARIASEESARASGDSANAVQISTVAATASSKNRTFAQAITPTPQAPGDLWMNVSDSNKMYRWDGSSWVPVEDTRISANAAAITTESTARATADSALAQQITTLTSTVNGNTASISTVQSTVNGLQARYGVSLNVNGYVTGFVQNNDGTSGSFTVLADRFSVVAPNGGSPVTPFSVTAGGVQINGNLIVNGSIVGNQFDLTTMVKRGTLGWSGSNTPAVNNKTVVAYTDIGPVGKDGSYRFDYDVRFSAQLGVETSTYNGLPLTTRYESDGYVGLEIIGDGGAILASVLFDGAEFENFGVGTYQITKQGQYVADRVGAAQNNARLQLVVYRTNADTGIINDGDNYQRRVGGVYTATFTNSSAKWTIL